MQHEKKRLSCKDLIRGQVFCVQTECTYDELDCYNINGKYQRHFRIRSGDIFYVISIMMKNEHAYALVLCSDGRTGYVDSSAFYVDELIC